MINAQQQYVTPDGRLTQAGLQLFQAQQRRIADLTTAITVLEGKMGSIGSVTKPDGGATEDAEARTAIDAIIDAAS